MRRRRGTDRHVVGLAKMSFGKHEHEARLAHFRVSNNNVLEEVRLLGRRGGHVGLPRFRAAAAGWLRRCSAPVLGAGARPCSRSRAHRFGFDYDFKLGRRPRTLAVPRTLEPPYERVAVVLRTASSPATRGAIGLLENKHARE